MRLRDLFQAPEFRVVQASAVRAVQGSGFRVQGSWFAVEGSGCAVPVSGISG